MQTTQTNIKPGDFTGLADNYTKFRPGYAPSVLKAILGVIDKDVQTLDCADVGAGTGIWTRQLAAANVKSVRAVEPNDDMRNAGIAASEGLPITWAKGTGEETGLADGSVDLLSMASSFHWTDFEKATAEFNRVLRPEGRFVALWNPRYIDNNPLLVEIEQLMYELAPHISRVSSGRSSFVETLSERLANSPYFDDFLYLEGRHTVQLSVEHYMGAWRSVNDIRAQMGEAKFYEFMDKVFDKVKDLETIDCTYLTRAWMVKKRS